MPMNSVIYEKRKALGLTQEQVAEYLNVSIPAVSKWETGQTSPDISLLPPLARLLKIDLNTLFCFQEDMSQQEISYFCNEITNIVHTKGIAEGVETAKQKICEYPHNETLLHCLALQLDGLLILSGASSDETRPYDTMLITWYRQLAKSNDSKISNSACFMLASRFIREGNYDEAQKILDFMPDNEDIISSMTDKRMLQVMIYQQQGRADEAARDLQNALLIALNKVQTLLYKMVDAELASGEIQNAEKIAVKASQMPELFDLWEYNSFVAPFQIAVAEKNADKCVGLLRKMLAAMLKPWDMGNSPLFWRIAKVSNPGQMLPAILSEMENISEDSFLKDSGELKELLSEYKKLEKYK